MPSTISTNSAEDSGDSGGGGGGEVHCSGFTGRQSHCPRMGRWQRRHHQTLQTDVVTGQCNCSANTTTATTMIGAGSDNNNTTGCDQQRAHYQHCLPANIPRSVSLAMAAAAALTAAAATAGVTSAAKLSTESHSSSSHHHHHHGSGEISLPNTESLGSTVRRFSLNILNTSTSALDQLKSLYQHSHHYHHQPESETNSRTSSFGNILSDSSSSLTFLDSTSPSSEAPEANVTSIVANATKPHQSTSLVTSTLSNLADLFPGFLSKSTPFTTGQPLSTFGDEYEDTDDYLGLVGDNGGGGHHQYDSSKEFSSILDDSSGSSSSPTVKLMSQLSSQMLASSEDSDDDTSEQMLVRLMRKVMRHANQASQSLTGSGEMAVTSDAETSQFAEANRSQSSDSFFASNKPNIANLLSDSSPISLSASDYPSSSSSSTSLLIPSFSSLTSSSAVVSAVSNHTSPVATAAFTAVASTANQTLQHHHHNHHSHHTAAVANNNTMGTFAALTSPGGGFGLAQMFSGATANITDFLEAPLLSSTPDSSLASYPGSLANEYATPFATMVDSLTESSTLATAADPMGPLSWLDIVIIVLKVLILGTIIFAAIFGNMLVIISVFRHHRLRITTNYFIVSLAFADILVALFAMTFNASVVISGRWLFNMVVCDFWNSCDVLFSTASIMHLSCISYDRYYAIIKPLDYPMKITTKRVAMMITCVWISSALISYIPIFTGIYTTKEAMEARHMDNANCEWIVNIPYALISSTVSFWLPCGFMLTAYYKIYREAIKQEKFIYKTQQMVNASNHHHHHHQQQQQSSRAASNAGNTHLNAPRHSSTSENNVIQIQTQHRNSHAEDPESGSSTPTKRTISKMKREHKAAKTLGIIMGAFILCWLPFFIWYVTSTICGSSCNTPKLLVDLLFWVGYLNSAMNPIIYAYFNREFREAFKETLRNIFCCCLHLRCLESQRSDAISFSCTYRSTMDVGLVENKYVKD